MQLSDGDLARHGDVWLRIITSEKYITKTGLHYAALKGALKAAKANRPWTSEASGRLRSLSGTPDQIAAHAVEYCEKLAGGQKFAGLMFAQVAVLNDEPASDQLMSVHYTPITTGKFSDNAHADLTVTGPEIEPKSEREEQLLQFLHGKLQIVHPYQMAMLPEAKGVAEVVASAETKAVEEAVPTTVLERLGDVYRSIKNLFAPG